MFKSKYFKLIGSAVILSLTLSACSNPAKQKNDTQYDKVPSSDIEEKITSYIYTANESGSISKINVSTNKVVSTIKDECSPHNVQLSSDGKIVAYTSAAKMEKGETEH